MISPADVTGFEVRSGFVDVQLANGHDHHRSRLLVASDGRSSDLRAIAGIKTVDWPASQWGIVATIAHTHPHHGRAVQHFLPAGPFAVLPLTDNRVSLVWTEQRDFASKVTKMDDENFCMRCALRMGDELADQLGRVVAGRTAQCLSPRYAGGARLCERAFCAGWRCGPWHALDCRAGAELWSCVMWRRWRKLLIEAHRLGPGYWFLVAIAAL